ncbi:TPR-like protein [Schizophyllum commune Tattone D]|nr:TPR-like protein [Schizophyllum commune Tattone D]
MDHYASQRPLYEEVPASADELSDEEEVETSDDSASDVSSEDALADPDNDQDFDRLVQSIRQNARTDASGLAHDWDQQLVAQNATFRDDLKAASGIGIKRANKGKGKGKRVPRTGPTLSHQVRALLGDGNQAYVDADLPPPSEWMRLAQQSRGNGAAQQALYCYAKAYAADPDNVAVSWDREALAREVNDLRAARASLVALLRRLPHDLNVLAALRPLLVELGDLAACAEFHQTAWKHYQEAFPTGQAGADGAVNPFGVLEILVLADLHSALGAHQRAIHVVKTGMRWLQGRGTQAYWDAVPDDREYDLPIMVPRPLNEGDIPPGYFPLDLNARQRLAVARIRMGDTEEGKLHASVVLAEEPTDYAPLFAEIGDAYFEKGLWAEAKGVYEVLGGDVGTSSIQILMQAAACYHMLGELQEAAEVYESVIQADPTLNDAKMKLAGIYEATGEVHRAYDLVCQVIDSRKRRARDPADTREGTAREGTTDPSTSLFAEDRTATARKAPKPRTGLTREAMEKEREREAAQGWARVKELWGQVVGGEGEDTDVAPVDADVVVSADAMIVDSGADGDVEAGNGPTQDDAKRKGKRPDRVTARREWLLEAEKLIEMFRETRRLFTTDRHGDFKGIFRAGRRRKRTAQEAEAEEDRMASRLQMDLESKRSGRKASSDEKIEHFRTIHFDDWLRMTMQYCFLVTRDDDYPLAEEILRHMMLSNAYVSQARQNTLRIALATCAIAAQRFDIVVEQTRKIVYTHQFNDEPIRLLLASLASGLRPTDAFIRATLQKFLFREMKLRDAASVTPDLVRWVPGRRWTYAGGAGGAKGEEEDDEEDKGEKDEGSGSADRPPLPKEYSPVNMIAYGMTCVAARSYQSALVYLLHAYDYSPDDPVLCLLLAIASLGRAMQRQADNRHHLVAQALAFLSKYRTVRSGVRGGRGETDYNFGRAFQQLGLFSQAVTHYERVLKRAEAGETVVFVREAAYNLSLIYSVTGARPLADALYRKWLSI